MILVLDLPPLLAHLVALHLHQRYTIHIVEVSEVYPLAGTNILAQDPFTTSQLKALSLSGVMNLSRVIINYPILNYEASINSTSTPVAIVYDTNQILNQIKSQLAGRVKLVPKHPYPQLRENILTPTPNILIIKSINHGRYGLDYLYINQQPVVWLPMITNNSFNYFVDESTGLMVVNHNVVHFDLVNMIKLAQVIVQSLPKHRL